MYSDANDTLAGQEEKIAKIAHEYGITADQVRDSARSLERCNAELAAIAEETENIARASLTAMASDKILNNEFGDEVIDAFAQSVGGNWEQ
jgi:hypothetical protein